MGASNRPPSFPGILMRPACRFAALLPRRASAALVLGLACWLGAAPACAQGANFSTRVGLAVLCVDDVEPGFLYNALRKTKAPSRREQGAYWFAIAEPLFGVPVTEVFVSDGSSRHNFVGVVSSLAPEQLAEAIASGAPAAGTFKRVNPADKFSPYRSAAGAQIVFHGKKSKLFCRRDRGRLLD